MDEKEEWHKKVVSHVLGHIKDGYYMYVLWTTIEW